MGNYKKCAVAVATAGLAPIPVFGKKPCIGGFQKFKGIGIRGAKALATRCPGADIGILTRISGVAVVDIDVRKRKIARCIIRYLGKPGAIVETRRGWHFYYANPAKIRGKVGIIDRVDLKAAGGSDLVVFPPTANYRFIDPSSVLKEKNVHISFEEGLSSFDSLTDLDRANLLQLVEARHSGGDLR